MNQAPGEQDAPNHYLWNMCVPITRGKNWHPCNAANFTHKRFVWWDQLPDSLFGLQEYRLLNTATFLGPRIFELTGITREDNTRTIDAHFIGRSGLFASYRTTMPGDLSEDSLQAIRDSVDFACEQQLLTPNDFDIHEVELALTHAQELG